MKFCSSLLIVTESALPSSETVNGQIYTMINKLQPLPDPEEKVHGKCGTCGHQIEMLRWEANPPPMKKTGFYDELYYTECVKCKELSEKVKGVGKASGNKIFLMRKV